MLVGGVGGVVLGGPLDLRGGHASCVVFDQHAVLDEVLCDAAEVGHHIGIQDVLFFLMVRSVRIRADEPDFA